MNESTALDSFLDKWRTRWPEWRVVEAFVPAQQRQLAVAWFTLLQEFSDATNVAGDPLPADAKLAWWGEELRDWSRRRSRHPLGRLLEPHPAAWFELSEALPVLIRLREELPSVELALDASRPLVDAVGRVESSLFQHPPSDALLQALSAQLLAERVNGGSAESSRTQWAQLVLSRWPSQAGAALPRRLWSAVARARLQQSIGKAGDASPLAPARALWTGWRAARQR